MRDGGSMMADPGLEADRLAEAAVADRNRRQALALCLEVQSLRETVARVEELYVWSRDVGAYINPGALGTALHGSGVLGYLSRRPATEEYDETGRDGTYLNDRATEEGP